MEVFEAILSTEILAGILIIGAFAMAIRSTLHFSREAADLRPKLNEVERELNRLRNGTQERKKAIQTLSLEVAPIKEKETQIRLYYEQLQAMDLEYEKKEHAQTEKAEAEKRRRIQRKRMGFENSET
jgi:chromosome segregation ATPase